MLFNSYEFLLAFLPACLAGYFTLGRRGPTLPVLWLIGMSFVFYAASGPSYVWILVGSLLFNYCSGKAISLLRDQNQVRAAQLITGIAIAADLAVLGYYKYSGFVIANAAHVFGLPQAAWNVVLPVGISFYTFTQIAFLVDAYKGRLYKAGLPEYALFVTYFPHLIAGPILHHAEMIPQFVRKQTATFSADNVATGLAIFIVGLSKKILLADSVAPYSDAVFGAKDSLSFADAWVGALAYTLQLYFDFSGYCDMAIGISRMLNIDLPLNFYSPYKATSIIEFWRRWHMTLSRFLRDYLYIPLGGNQRGTSRRYLNLMITMLLGGLWHGAAWTFVIWGGLHGLYLLINHAFRTYAPRWLTSLPGFSIATQGVTFAAVVVAWVFFRAENVGSALHILRAMAGIGSGWPLSLPLLKESPSLVFVLIGAGLAIVWLLPNTQQLFNLPFHPSIEGRPGSAFLPTLEREYDGLLAWRPSTVSAVVYGLLLAASVLFFARTTRFLYFQF